jgi:hypothetical protein
MNARLLVLCLSLAACGVNVPDVDRAPGPVRRVAHEDGTVSFGSARYQPVTPAELRITAARTIWQAMAPLGAVPESMEGRQALEFSIRQEGDAMIAVMTRRGLMDDAVSADEVRVEFQQDAAGWTPVEAYTRRQCRRGPASGWTTEQCS